MRLSGSVGAALLFAASSAQADRIVMDNGDLYSGSVVRMSGGIVYVKGEFGDLRLPWARIAELETDQPLQVTLPSGTRIAGTLTVADGVVRFREPELAGLSLPRGDVAAMAPRDAPAVNVDGRFNIGAAATGGNTETESYHADGEFIARTIRNRFRVGGEFNYGSEDGRRTENNALAAASYDHFLGERWYLSNTISLERDEFKDLDLRTTAGVGLGYQFRDLPSDRLAVELGLSYVHEDFDAAEDEGQPAARYALNFLRALSLGPTVFHRHEVLAGLEEVENVLLRTETGIRFPLVERFTGTLQVNYDYDWEPAPDAENEDVTYLITLGYEFKP